MSTLYKGLPRRAAGVMNPEEEDDEYVPPVLAPAPAGEDSYYSPHRVAGEVARPLEPVAAWTYEQVRDAAYEAEMERGRGEAVRPLEPVAAVTYAEARALAEKAAKATVALEKAFKHSQSDAASYKEAEWNEVPETDATAPISAAWYSCVKRYRFIQYDGSMGSPKLIIEVELMGGTSLRYILKLSQVKGVITKSNTRDTHGYLRIEEVIIDQRQPHYGYTPEQVKLKFAGAVSALAFQMALMDAL
jgi:hypothetical protein